MDLQQNPYTMYNRDKSILYYYAVQQKDFITKLNISHFTFTKHLTNGTYYLGKYLFLRERIDTAKIVEITLAEIAIMLQNDRVNFNKTKPIVSFSKPGAEPQMWIVIKKLYLIV